MVRVIRTSKKIFSAQQRDRMDGMINELISIKMDPIDTNNELVQLMNLIIRAHGLMQKIIWEGSLETEVEKYRALRMILPTPSQKGVLDSLWRKESQRALGSY